MAKKISIIDIWRALEAKHIEDCPTGPHILSRVFAIFSEDIMRLYFNGVNSKYSDLGRPSRKKGRDGPVWDFTIEDDGKLYVAEMNCEISLDGYKYACLDSEKWVKRQEDSNNFGVLMKIAKGEDRKPVRISSSTDKALRDGFVPDGVVIIWGSVDSSTRQSLIAKYDKLHDVLSVEDAISKLILKEPGYLSLIDRMKHLIDEFYDRLSGSDM